MANRYWVGGTADWDATAGSKWSTSSGGAGGAAVPAAGDRVWFDSNSGSGTCTITATANCGGLDTNGFTGTIAGTGGLYLSNSSTAYTFRLAAGMTWTHSGNLLIGTSSASADDNQDCSITTNGKTLANLVDLRGTGAKTLVDSLTTTAQFALVRGILYAGAFTITCRNFYSLQLSANTRELNFTTGKLIMTGDDATVGFSVFDIDTAGFTLTISAGVEFKFTGSGAATFDGSGLTYRNVTHDSSSELIITGANTMDNLAAVNASAHTLTLPNGVTQTINTAFTFSGGQGANAILRSASGGSAATISQASGAVVAEFANIRDSTVTGGATFTAKRSVNTSNNTGWTFTKNVGMAACL